MGDEIFNGRFLEHGDTQPCIAGFDHFRFDAFDLDFFTNERDDDRFRHVFSCNRQRDLRIGIAPHFLDCSVECHILDGNAIQFCNQITRLDTGAVGRCIFNRRDDFDVTVFSADFNAQTAEFALCAFFQFLKGFLVEIG